MLHALFEILMLLGLIPGKKEAEGSQMHTAMRWIGILIVLTITFLVIYLLASG